MDSEERSEIIGALNKAKEAYGEALKNWNFPHPVRFEVRELRRGDESLGESVVIDEIKEYLENQDKKVRA